MPLQSITNITLRLSNSAKLALLSEPSKLKPSNKPLLPSTTARSQFFEYLLNVEIISFFCIVKKSKLKQSLPDAFDNHIGSI